jgi:hypothetical protein
VRRLLQYGWQPLCDIVLMSVHVHRGFGSSPVSGGSAGPAWQAGYRGWQLLLGLLTKSKPARCL